MLLKCTVCEMPDKEEEFLISWESLREHVSQHAPDLVLLPEMPFCKWVASDEKPDQRAMELSVKKHRDWMGRLDELDARYIVFSMPVLKGSDYFNTAFLYEKNVGLTALHTKVYFPEEAHFWEASWYRQGEKRFDATVADGFSIGVLLCTEMWFMEHARAYGKQGVDLLLCPRATGAGSVEQWIRCGQTLAVISGAFCLSSNRTGRGDNDFVWGGASLVAEPGEGNLLGVTGTGVAGRESFLTVSIDLDKSRDAKTDYPLYVKE